MWAGYGWLIWVVFGGLFLWFLARRGGCCGGHGNAGGHGGPGGNGTHGSPSEVPPAGPDAQRRSHGGCH